MAYPLRPHQQQAVQATIEQIKKGRQRILLTMALGTGRMAVLMHILRKYVQIKGGINNIRAIIIHDRQELVLQSVSLFENFFPEYSLGYESPNGSIFITNYSTLIKQADRYSLMSFDIIVCFPCEALGIGRKDNILNNFLSRLSKSIIVGVDERIEESQLLLGEPIFTYSVAAAIEDKLLVPIVYTRMNILFDLAPGESIDQIEDRHYTIPERIEQLSNSIVAQIKSEKTIVICPSQLYAHRLSDSLNSLQKDSSYSNTITADTSRSVVSARINDFKNRSHPVVLTSVDMLASVDLPNVKNLVLARRIGSESFLRQLISRGLRSFDGKSEFRIIDYFDNEQIESLLKSPEFNFIQPIFRNGKDISLNKSTLYFRDRKDVEGVLGVKDIAEELAEIIYKMPAEKGAMVGVFGRWGRGKTFLMDQAWEFLKQKNVFERVDFHAWKYQETPASWAYLYETFANQYLKGSKGVFGMIKFYKRLFGLNLRRNKFWHLLGVVVTVFTFIFLWFLTNAFTFQDSKDLEKLAKYFGVPVIAISLGYQVANVVRKEFSAQAKHLFAKYGRRYSFKEHLGLQAEVQKEVLFLLQTWISKKELKNKKLLLFIDDIDRCTEEKIIQIIDSLRIMLDDDEISKRVIVVAAIDERILKRAIKNKYRESIKLELKNNVEEVLNKLTQEYLDKLFICSLKLGDLSDTERVEFFSEFIKNDIEIEKQEKETAESGEVVEESFAADITDRIIEFSEAQAISENSKEPVTESRSEKLSLMEAQLLKDGVANFDGTTPRELRIFYYRYLLGKNLLIKAYSKQGSNNVWNEQKNIKLFINLIIKYSSLTGADLVAQHTRSVLQEKGDNVKVQMLESVTIKKTDYLEALKVLDLVLAY